MIKTVFIERHFMHMNTRISCLNLWLNDSKVPKATHTKSSSVVECHLIEIDAHLDLNIFIIG